MNSHILLMILSMVILRVDLFANEDEKISKASEGIRSIIANYGNSDKDSCHSYVEFYAHLLEPYRDHEVNLLEIGTFEGGNAIIWHEHLPHSNLYLGDDLGIIQLNIWSDMDPDRCHYFVRNFYTDDAVVELKEACPAGFDIIIDDGSHLLGDQIFLLEKYVDLLRPGGVLIIEDIQKPEYLQILNERVPNDHNLQVEIIDLRRCKGRYDDLIFLVRKKPSIASKKFLKKISQPIPGWMVDQIETDLAPFSQELSCSYIDELFASQGNQLCLTRVQIRNGLMNVICSESSKSHCVTPLIIYGLRKLQIFVPLPDMDFVFTSNDSITYTSPNWPIFAESKNVDTPGILIPDRFAWKGYVPEKTEVIEGNSLYPWDAKIPMLFFRGSDTCRDHGINWNMWDYCPRVLLTRLSLKHPHIIDAKFFYSLHNWGMVEQARQEGLITGDYFRLKDHPRYKYLVDLDGNCASCPRTASILHSNSVVFKEVSPSRQWWYRLLRPYVHYIPVSSDLSDLITQYEWAMAHDDECKKISENGQRLVLDVLSEETIFQFFYHLLVAYSEKQEMYYWGN